MSQQGDKLGKYRLRNGKFEPSAFDIVLINEKGEWVKGSRSEQFVNSLIVDNAVLEPGKYLVMVSPNWNEEASND